MNKAGHSFFQPPRRWQFLPSWRRGVGRNPLHRLGLIAVLLCWPVVASAQVVKLLDYTNVVRFNHTDNLDAVAWTAPFFNDSNWSSGSGLLAFEDNPALLPLIRTALPSPANLEPPGHAVYFRAHFNYPFNRLAILTLSNYVDDGAVFYLNGIEMRQIRLAAGPVNHLTLATGSSTENEVDVFNSVANSLIVGDNVLAVSVHQSASTSADIVFGSTIWAEVIAPLTITADPQDQVAAVNGSVAFSVAVSGTRPSFRWQFMATNGSTFANYGNATNATLALANLAANQAGFYRCVVTNPVHSVTSAVARLALTPDITPPRLVSAIADETTNWIILTFSERLLFTTATNLRNYRITELGGTNELTATNAAVNASLVRLKVPPWVGYPGPSPRDYVLTVNNVADSYTNVIAPDTRIGIAFWRPVLPMNAFWNWCEDFDLTGQDWTSPAYNEATNEWYSGGQWIIPDPVWDPVGRAAFYFPVVPSYWPWSPGNTVLTFGHPCYYFRTRFVTRPDASPPQTLRVKYLADDGAVFYLNGVELFRDNLPDGVVDYRTPAISQPGSAPVEQIKNVAVTNCAAGTNVLAVELHPFSTLPLIELGIAFRVNVDATVAPIVPSGFSPFRPWLGLARISDGAVVISWMATACVLQTKSRVEDEWSDLPGATSPFTNAVTATRFFRLRCP